MKKSLFKSIGLLVFIAFLGIGCSSSPSCSSTQAATDSDRITELGEVYVDDPLDLDKCQDFIDAVRQFVEDYRDCDDVDQGSIDSIEQSIAGLPCA